MRNYRLLNVIFSERDSAVKSIAVCMDLFPEREAEMSLQQYCKFYCLSKIKYLRSDTELLPITMN